MTVLLATAVSFALLCGFAGLAVIIEARRFARKRREQQPIELPNNPKVTVIVPCRGQIHNFRGNCEALLAQDHPNFEVLFVAENENDVVVPVVRNLMRANRFTRIGLIFSGRAEFCSQKVHQLRVGLAHISNNTSLVAFADSNLQLGTSWLRWLVGRLSEPKIGAVTGGIWCVPRNQTLINCLYCSISNALACWFAPRTAPSLWGSWAARRDLIEACGLEQTWATSFSDVWSAREAIRLHGCDIVFEPRSIGTKTVSTNFRGLRRNLLRGFKSARTHLGLKLDAIVIANLVVQVAFWGALSNSILGWNESYTVALSWAITALSIYFLGCAAGLARTQLGKLYAPISKHNRRAKLWDILAWPITTLVTCSFGLASYFATRLHWNGIVYRHGAGAALQIAGHKSQAISMPEGVVRMHVPLPSIPPHGEVPQMAAHGNREAA